MRVMRYQIVLNVLSQNSNTIVKLCTQFRPLEVATAIKGLKIGKAAGLTGMVSEMMKAVGGFGSRRMTDLIKNIVKEGCIPDDWSILVPVLVPTTPACTWWNRPEEYNSSGKLESTHPSRTSVKFDQVFFWCRVSHACQR